MWIWLGLDWFGFDIVKLELDLAGLRFLQPLLGLYYVCIHIFILAQASLTSVSAFLWLQLLYLIPCQSTGMQGGLLPSTPFPINWKTWDSDACWMVDMGHGDYRNSGSVFIQKSRSVLFQMFGGYTNQLETTHEWRNVACVEGAGSIHRSLLSGAHQ